MRSALYAVTALPEPITGYRIVGTDGTITILHAAAGMPVPVGAIVIRDGATDWTWLQVKALVPSGRWRRIAEATWPVVEIIEGVSVTVRRRGKLVDVPAGVSVTETDLPPHFWLGET